jgi:hypothetical protein
LRKFRPRRGYCKEAGQNASRKTPEKPGFFRFYATRKHRQSDRI